MFRVVCPSVGASVHAQVDWRHSPLIALISNILWLTVAFSALTLLVGHCCMAGAQQQHGAQHAANGSSILCVFTAFV